MSPLIVGLIGIIILFLLLLSGMHIGFAMALAGVFGVFYIVLILNEYHENTKVLKHEILIGVFRGFVLSCFRDKISFLLSGPLFMMHAR